jgi:hypothetical protein
MYTKSNISQLFLERLLSVVKSSSRSQLPFSENEVLSDALIVLANKKCLFLPHVRGNSSVPVEDERASHDLQQLCLWTKAFPGCDWILLTGHESGTVVLEATSIGVLAAIRDLYPSEIEETLCAVSGDRALAFYQYPVEMHVRCPQFIMLIPGLIMYTDGGRVLLPHKFEVWPNLEAQILAIPDWLRDCAFEENEYASTVEADLPSPSHLPDCQNTAQESTEGKTGNAREDKKNSRLLRRNSVKISRQVRRLAIYLDMVGVHPHCIGQSWKELHRNLVYQYLILTKEQKRVARLDGRKRIREVGFVAASDELLADRAFTSQPPEHAESTITNGNKCPHCQSRKPKVIWESKAFAEAFCAGNGDTGLHEYPCPYGYGWHIGHLHQNNIGEESQ